MFCFLFFDMQLLKTWFKQTKRFKPNFTIMIDNSIDPIFLTHTYVCIYNLFENTKTSTIKLSTFTTHHIIIYYKHNDNVIEKKRKHMNHLPNNATTINFCMFSHTQNFLRIIIKLF